MCRSAVTLRLNAKTFSFFFLSLSLWKRRRGGKFMALQLLSLVTVNWLLFEAVRVFYGHPFVPGLCLGSHLWGERSYRRPRRRTLLPLTLQPRDYCRWHVSVLSANPSPPPPVPSPSVHLGASRDKRDCSSVQRWPGSPALFIYKGRLWVALHHWEGSSTTKDLCLYPQVPLQPGEWLGRTRGKKEKGFSNNLSKSTQNFIDSAQTIVYSGTLLCVYVCNHWTIPSYIRLAMCSWKVAMFFFFLT